MDIWEVDGGETSGAGLLEDGSPDPAYAEALGLVSAPPRRRALAAGVDIATHLLLQVPFWIWTAPLLLKLLRDRITWFGFVNHPDHFMAVLMGGISLGLTTVYALVQLVLHGRRGLTLGKGVIGIRSVNVTTLERPGIGRVMLRALVVWGPLVLPLVTIAFLVSPLLDKGGRGRGWHDRIGATWLVDVRAGLNPYDEKRMRIARKTVAAAPRTERPALPSLTAAGGAPAMLDFRPSERLSAGVLGDAELTPRPSGGGHQAGGALATRSDDTTAGTPASHASQPRRAVPTSLRDPLPPASQPTPPAPAAPAAPAPAAPAAPAPAAPARFVLTFDTGQEVVVDALLLLGRNPQSTDPSMRAVAITDEEYSVSKTHLSVRPTAQGLELVDRGSSNGTTLTRQGVRTALVAGQPVLAQPGDTLQVGQRAAQVRLG